MANGEAYPGSSPLSEFRPVVSHGGCRCGQATTQTKATTLRSQIKGILTSILSSDNRLITEFMLQRV